MESIRGRGSPLGTPIETPDVAVRRRVKGGSWAALIPLAKAPALSRGFNKNEEGGSAGNFFTN